MGVIWGWVGFGLGLGVGLDLGLGVIWVLGVILVLGWIWVWVGFGCNLCVGCNFSVGCNLGVGCNFSVGCNLGVGCNLCVGCNLGVGCNLCVGCNLGNIIIIYICNYRLIPNPINIQNASRPFGTLSFPPAYLDWLQTGHLFFLWVVEGMRLQDRIEVGQNLLCPDGAVRLGYEYFLALREIRLNGPFISFIPLHNLNVLDALGLLL